MKTRLAVPERYKSEAERRMRNEGLKWKGKNVVKDGSFDLEEPYWTFEIDNEIFGQVWTELTPIAVERV